MLKHKEAADPRSCWNKARPDELVFVLLERDVDAPDTIRDWVRRRIKRGKNKPDDAQMTEALECARLMEIMDKDFFKDEKCEHTGCDKPGTFDGFAVECDEHRIPVPGRKYE